MAARERYGVIGYPRKVRRSEGETLPDFSCALTTMASRSATTTASTTTSVSMSACTTGSTVSRADRDVREDWSGSAHAITDAEQKNIRGALQHSQTDHRVNQVPAGHNTVQAAEEQPRSDESRAAN